MSSMSTTIRYIFVEDAVIASRLPIPPHDEYTTWMKRHDWSGRYGVMRVVMNDEKQ